MVKQAPSQSPLAAIVGADSVARGSPEYAVDGITPDSVVRPGSYDEIAAVLRYVNEAGLAVIPLGGRNHTSLGNPPSRYDVALDLARLDAIVEFEPADLTITCRAGITLGRLREVTAQSGLRVPFDPSVVDSATVGGILAANLSGPAQLSLGAPRDFTIGMRVVTADGLLTRAGGRVVKNVAGYDLCKLYIGSLGTLGVLVEATFKTIPVPIGQETLSLEFTDSATACSVASASYNRGHALESAVVSRHQAKWLLTVRLAGTRAAVARSGDELRSMVDSPAEDLSMPSALDAPTIARFTTLPTRLPALLERVGSAYPAATLEGYPTTGLCLLAVDRADPAALAAIAEQSSAKLTFDRLPPEAKRGLDVFGPPPSGGKLMRAIKREWDPNGVLSPGRMIGRI